MGSCFKFTMCRKRAYNFQNQPYEPTAQAAEGRYRISTAEVDGWDPEVSLKVSGDAREEKQPLPQEPQAIVETTVLASPSNSDVTFGETFKDANENNEEDLKDKKKKEKNKKEKSKKGKSKKEKSKKEKSKKKNKDKEENENTVNENAEKDQKIENDEDTEEKKDGDKNGDMDISNMETLPREERHIVTQSEQTTLESEQVTTQELITDSPVIEKEDDRGTADNNGHVSDRVSIEDDHNIERGEHEVDLREPLADDKSTHSEDDIHDRRSSLSGSDLEIRRLDDVEIKGEDRHSIEGGGAYPYPEPEEQIDVRNIRNLTDDMSLVTEESSVAIQEADDGSAVTTVTKVTVTETVDVKATTYD